MSVHPRMADIAPEFLWARAEKRLKEKACAEIAADIATARRMRRAVSLFSRAASRSGREKCPCFALEMDDREGRVPTKYPQNT